MAHALNLADAVNAAIPTLHATSTADLTACTAAELYQYVSDALRDLCMEVKLLVVERALMAVPDSPEYDLAAHRPVAVLAVWYGSKLLYATPVEEVEALDQAWPDTTGTAPERTLGNVRGATLLRVYPKRDVGVWALNSLLAVKPADVSGVDATRELPEWLAPYFTLAAIEGAAGREGEERMPEQTAFCREIRNLWEQAVRGVYGEIL